MIDYQGFAFPKGRLAALERDDKRTAKETADKKAKATVKARDKGHCRVCGRKSTEVHEALVFKSAMGVASLQNSIAVCAQPSGWCHQMLQKHQIRVVGTDCSNPLVFEMREGIAAKVFGRKPLPAHVKILALLALALWLAVPASAGPIGSGAWVPTPASNESLYTSEDCDWLRGSGTSCHIFSLLPAGTEMLTGGWGYTDLPALTKIFGITDYTDAPGLSYDGLSLSYDTGHDGFVVSSWGGTNMLLFRQVMALYTDIWVAVEDLANPIIKDYDDAVFYARISAEPPVCIDDCSPPPCRTCEPEPVHPIPEPATAALLAIGLCLWAARVKRAYHLMSL